MAFLIAGAVRMGVKAVRSGVQAHQDYQVAQSSSTSEGSPSDPASATLSPPQRTDRYGRPKSPGPVYDLVWKAEHKMKGKNKVGRGADTASNAADASDRASPPRRGSMDKAEMALGGENYGPQDYTAEKTHGDAPPSYNEATDDYHPAERSGFGNSSSPTYTTTTASRGVSSPSAPHGKSNPPAPYGVSIPSAPSAPHAPYGSSRRRSSDSSSDSGHSTGEDTPEMRAERARIGYLPHSERKAAKRAAKAQRRLLRAEYKAQRKTMKAEARYGRDMARYP